MLGIVTRCRRNSNPGHDHNNRWKLRTYWITIFILFGIIGLLILLSLLLEYGREYQWSFTARLTKQETAIPLILACVIVLCAIMEAICLYPTIMNMIREGQSRVTGGGDIGDEIIEEEDLNDNNPKQNLDQDLEEGSSSGDNELSPKVNNGGFSRFDNETSRASNNRTANSLTRKKRIGETEADHASGGTPRLDVDIPLPLSQATAKIAPDT